MIFYQIYNIIIFQNVYNIKNIDIFPWNRNFPNTVSALFFVFIVDSFGWSEI